ncbi:MAG: hypothetical protein H6707_09295 [Deltaproteobacteria bacterium]|nr:hypothetical protein [Deltaproteobacteria bacterium]
MESVSRLALPRLVGWLVSTVLLSAIIALLLSPYYLKRTASFSRKKRREDRSRIDAVADDSDRPRVIALAD